MNMKNGLAAAGMGLWAGVIGVSIYSGIKKEFNPTNYKEQSKIIHQVDSLKSVVETKVGTKETQRIINKAINELRLGCTPKMLHWQQALDSINAKAAGKIALERYSTALKKIK